MSALKYVVSADSHIMEPFDLWTKALGDKHGEALPQVVNEYRGEKTKFYFTGYEYIKIGDFEPVDTSDSQGGSKSLEQELLDKVERTSLDPDLRLELMDQDGVSAEIINPTYLLYTLRTPGKPEMVQDCCTVYNDYIADYVSHNPSRMLGTAMIDMENIDWAVQELQRARKRNLRTVIINTDVRDGMPPFRDKAYDPFWAAAQDLEVPVTLHIITGKERDPYTLQGVEREDTAKGLLRVLSDVGPILANEFIFGGILARFPKLQIILGEYEISWLPWFMFRCRQLEGSLGQSMDLPPLKRSVDEVMYNNVWHGVVDDEYFDRAYDVAGPKRIMWGSDFPHPRNTFPNTHSVLDRVFANVPEEVKIDVVGMNCARLFGLDIPAVAAAAAAE